MNESSEMRVSSEMKGRSTVRGSRFAAWVVALAALAALLPFVLPALHARSAKELREERGWATVPADTELARTADRRRLERSEWIDREKGVVSLPIEQAMEVVLGERGSEDGR